MELADAEGLYKTFPNSGEVQMTDLELSHKLDLLRDYHIKILSHLLGIRIAMFLCFVWVLVRFGWH